MPAILPDGGDYSPYLPDPGGASDEEIRRLREAQLAQEQAQALAQHQAYAQQLEAASQQVELKQGDLDLTNRLLQATDPTVDKSARKWLLGQISQRVGIDPKGETSKQVQQMLLGLQPETSEQLRRVLVEQVKGAAPGEVNQIIKGVLTGQVGGEALLAGLRVGAAQTGEYQAANAPGNAGSRVARPLPGAAGAAGAANAAVTGSLPDPGDRMNLGAGDTLAGGGGTPGLTGQAGLDQLRSEVRSEQPSVAGKASQVGGEDTLANQGLQEVYGYEPGDHYASAFKETAFKETPEVQSKLNSAIRKGATSIRTMQDMTDQAIEIMQKDPAALGTIGTLSQAFGSVEAQIRAMASRMGITENKLSDYAMGKTDSIEGLSRGDQTAVNAMKLQVLQAIATQSATTGGIARASDADVKMFKQGFSLSGDPNQAIASWRESAKLAADKHGQEVRDNGGPEDYRLYLGGTRPQDLSRLATSPNATEDVRAAAYNQMQRNLIKRGYTPEEADATLGGRPGATAPAGGGTGAARGAGGEGSTAGGGEQLGPTGGKLPNPIPGRTPEDKRRVETERQKKLEGFEDERMRIQQEHLRLSQHASERADRAEERQRRKDIQEIFSNLGHAIAKSFGGSIHFPAVSLGGEQDASAFVYRPTQHRTPPRGPSGGASGLAGLSANIGGGKRRKGED